jgi:(S)-ureidoglycine-glyoxylate aminotransferase
VPIGPVDPPPRLLMGPGPVNADPRALRAMSAQLVGQFDPAMTAFMNQTMELYRGVFRTANEATVVVDGTSRAGIEAALVSLVEPGDRVLVPIFGRFGHLLVEIAERCGAKVDTVEAPWGAVVDPEAVERAIVATDPKLVAIVQGDTSTTMCQPLADIGRICRDHGVLLYVDVTASIGGNAFEMDAWGVDVATAGLQKCLGGPSGSAPISLSPRAADLVRGRRHVEAGIRAADDDEPVGTRIASNYFDLAMILDYWGPRRLNHHTEATTMLYAARECARILLGEGLDQAFARHTRASRALTAGLEAMGLKLFGDQRHKMANVTGVHIPQGVDGEKVRRALLDDFNIEIGTSFGPLHGRIWRIGTMGYNARADAVLNTLGALEAILASEGVKLPRGKAVDAALAAYRGG